MVAGLQKIEEDVINCVNGKTIIPERQKEVREKVGIMSRNEDKRRLEIVLIQLKKSMHLRIHC